SPDAADAPRHDEPGARGAAPAAGHERDGRDGPVGEDPPAPRTGHGRRAARPVDPGPLPERQTPTAEQQFGRPTEPDGRQTPPADEQFDRREGHGPLAGEAPRTDRTEDERRVAADDRAAEQDPFLRQEQQLREEAGDVPPHDPGPRDPQDGSHRGCAPAPPPARCSPRRSPGRRRRMRRARLTTMPTGPARTRMDDLTVERVLRVVEAIPAGQVAAYGEIGQIVGVGPRLVGRILRTWGSGVPWWRVTSASGDHPLPERARPHWAAEGIETAPHGRGCRMAHYGTDLVELRERARPGLAELDARGAAGRAAADGSLDRDVAQEVVRRHPRGVVVAVQLAPRDELRGPLALLRMGG